MFTHSSRPVDSSTGQTAAASAPHAQPDFWRTAHAAVRGRQRWVLAITAAGATLGAGLGLVLGERLYTATGLVRLASALPPVLRETDQNRPIAMFDGFIQAQAQVMSGREVIDAAMKEGGWTKLHAGSAATPERFASFLKVESHPHSDFLQVKFTHPDPQVAAAAVQSVIGAYKDIFTREQAKAESSRMEVLQQRRAELTAQASKLQESIDRSTHGRTLTEIDALCTETTERIRKLRGALTDIQIAIEGGPGLLSKQSENASNSGSPAQWCAARIFKLECDLIEARAAGLYDTHPRIVQLEKSIKAYRDQLAALPHDEENNDPALTAAERRPLQEREANLRQMVEAAEAELKQFGVEREQLKQMDERSEALRRQLADTEQRLDALTTESSAGGRLTIVSAGARPMTAVLDNRAKECAAGTVLGAGVPFAALMLGTLVRRRYRTGEELAEDLAESVPFVTVLPRVDESGHAAPLAAQSIHAARARLIQPSGGPRVYLVSSANPGEGKSGVAMSLGLSFSAAGLRVLLIDADFTSRRLSMALGGADAPGLLEAADNLEAMSLHHLRAGPWMLTAGRAQRRDAGRLRPEPLRTMFAGLRQRFDAIVIDSDPLLSGVTAPLIAPHADGVILTVGSGARQKHVQQAVRHARQIGVPFVGAVFNYAGLSQFPPELRAAAASGGARTLPASAGAFGPLVGAVLESLSLTREEDMRLAPSGLNLKHAPVEEREVDAAQRRQQGRSAA